MMHFYPFHLAEYAAHTRHLTLMEDLAYRRLLDRYYLDEKAPQGSVETIARLLGMRGELESVASVLTEFFQETPDGWINARAERELETYRRRQENQVAAGRASAKARALRANPDTSTNDRSTTVQRSFIDGSTPVEHPLNERSTIKTKTKTKTTDPLSRTRGEDRAREETPPSEPARDRPAGAPSPEVRSAPVLARSEAPQSAPAPEPPPTTLARAIVDPGLSQALSAAIGAPPSPEAILEAWSEAGLPPAQRNEVELLLDRAIRLKPGRDLAWCRALFSRIAASPWCRGEVHSHPGSREWTLDYALGSEKRIAEVLAGRYDERTEARPASGTITARPGKQFSILGLPEEELARMLAVNPRRGNGAARPTLGAGKSEA